MFDDLEILNLSQSVARHAALRQNVIAQNVANADTPGYRARVVKPFSEIYAESSAVTGGSMRQTRPGHLGRANEVSVRSAEATTQDVAPDGNSVSIEDEMLKSIEVRRQYDLSLTVYKTSLGILRASIGKG